MFTIHNANPNITEKDTYLINTKTQLDYYQNMVKKVELFLKQSKEFLEPIEKQLVQDFNSVENQPLDYTNRLDEMLILLNSKK